LLRGPANQPKKQAPKGLPSGSHGSWSIQVGLPDGILQDAVGLVVVEAVEPGRRAGGARPHAPLTIAGERHGRAAQTDVALQLLDDAVVVGRQLVVENAVPPARGGQQVAMSLEQKLEPALGWCQTVSNSSQLGQYCCPLFRAETAPLGESGGAIGLEERSA
jgi:hypothetical protein